MGLNVELNDQNFILYAAKCYNNPQCTDTEEFYDDLKRFKYIKRLFGKYNENGDLRERLILNHIVILYNMFGLEATKMLFLRLDGFYKELKTFLTFLNYMPDLVVVNSHQVVYSYDIEMDPYIIQVLRELQNGV